MYDSFILMTIFDLAVVAAVLFVCQKLFRHRAQLGKLGQGFYLLLAGLILLGLFYITDLVLMWVAPYLVTMQVAMNWMDILHLELSWFVALIAVVCIASGVALVANVLLKIQNELESEISERKASEGEKEKLVTQLFHNRKIEALGTLAGGVAHDFNNIITVILNNAEMINLKQEQNLDISDSVENIISSSEKAAALVKQISTYSRLEAATLQPLNLAKEVMGALTMVRKTIPKTIKITSELDDSVPLVSSDATQISQLILNMCGNSHHAISEQEGEIKVAVYATGNEVSVDCVSLSIEDNGCGIEPQDMGKIYDPFFTTKEVNKGTGLGLSAVHGIVENHNAKISVESKIGQGTKFKIEFPIAERMQAVAPSVSIPNIRKNGNILLVEDDLEIGELYKDHLLSKGHKVTYCTNGNSALESFKQMPGDFDLIITDLAMPVLNGKELAEEALSLRPEIPIILITGYSDDVSTEAMDQIGVKNFLLKPVGFKELDASVARCL